jgi:hypothetical protein
MWQQLQETKARTLLLVKQVEEQVTVVAQVCYFNVSVQLHECLNCYGDHHGIVLKNQGINMYGIVCRINRHAVDEEDSHNKTW